MMGFAERQLFDEMAALLERVLAGEEYGMKVDITLVIYTTQDAPDEATPEQIEFLVEENFCLENHIERLFRELKPNTCNLCTHAEAFVGRASVSRNSK